MLKYNKDAVKLCDYYILPFIDLIHKLKRFECVAHVVISVVILMSILTLSPTMKNMH